MTILIRKTLAALLTLFCTLTAQAVDTTITVSGKVKPSTCTTGGNATYNIDLGQNHTQADLATAGSATGYVPQDVVLSDCPVDVHTVTATFAGTTDSLNPTMYANSSGAGFARQVAVQLQNATTGADVGNLTKMTVSASASQATFPLRARLFSSNGGVTPGLVTAVVTMDISYN